METVQRKNTCVFAPPVHFKCCLPTCHRVLDGSQPVKMSHQGIMDLNFKIRMMQGNEEEEVIKRRVLLKFIFQTSLERNATFLCMFREHGHAHVYIGTL